MKIRSTVPSIILLYLCGMNDSSWFAEYFGFRIFCNFLVKNYRLSLHSISLYWLCINTRFISKFQLL